MKMNDEEIEKLFRLIGIFKNALTLRIFYIVCDQQSCEFAAVMEKTGLSKNSTNHYLGHLRNKLLIKIDRKTRFYSPTRLGKKIKVAIDALFENPDAQEAATFLVMVESDQPEA